MIAFIPTRKKPESIAKTAFQTKCRPVNTSTGILRINQNTGMWRAIKMIKLFLLPVAFLAAVYVMNGITEKR